MKKTIISKVKKMLKKNKKYTEQDLQNAIVKVDKIINDIHEGKYVQLFKYGNFKLENNIARFSLPEKITCVGSCKGCYAAKQLYPNVRVSRLINLLLILYVLDCKSQESNGYFLSKFLSQVKLELDLHYQTCKKNKRKPIFRWHDSGDIFNLDYLKLMYDIAIANPQIQFYTYTKNRNMFTYFKINKHPSNFNIVSSYIYSHVNYFDLFGNFDEEFIALSNTFIQLRFHNEKAFMCNYNLDKFKERYESKYNKVIKLLKEYKDVVIYSKEHLDCGVCDACCSYTNTLFIKH